MVLSCNMFCQGFEKLQHKSYNNIQIYHKEVSTHQVRRYHSFLVEIIVKSVNFDTDVKIENFCHRDGK